MRKFEQQNHSEFPSNELDSTKLAFIGAAITTIGDLIGTMAAGLAIQEAEQQEKEDAPSNKDLQKQMTQMQKQLDYLTRRLQ